ncbi:WxcM-like domain-containing protein [Flavobacterium sp. ZE23DGlu08]|uniref:WxcM-like domain-containing protein n=1 Tax=Flavobacterium sp. ZE23DGlu08 TaxID=3059026 RepID=UPI00265F647D|nr:WxcM-like domain-containing protein [Flavobacterium sp. ZE23DGlu08]WKL45043.1 WxcM-like domain-containing protein [Flavobacterium sp. ZE23DGlu08]
MVPRIINGGSHSDTRGTVRFNNSFDATAIKRIYLIENNETTFVRGWQGHRIEQRWFSVLQGSFKIELIAIDNWENPSKELKLLSFIINAETLDVLHVPQGYLTSIQALKEGAKLLVMADYLLGTIQDEYRFDIDYFK